jgi:hypothetical protein
MSFRKRLLVRAGVILAPTAIMLLFAAPAALAVVIAGGKASARDLGSGGTLGTAGMATTAAAVALVALAAFYVAFIGWITQGRVKEAVASFVVPGEPVQLPANPREFERERDRRAA